MTEPSHNLTLSDEKVAALLDRAVRARQQGNVPAARALLRALAAHRPELPQVWLALATAAETRAEQRQALERVIALDPQNPLAQRGLARMGDATRAVTPPAAPPATATMVLPEVPAPVPGVAPPIPADAPGVGAAPALTPTTLTPEERARAIRWPLYVVIGAAVLLVVLAALWLRRTPSAPTALPTATPALPGAVRASPTSMPGTGEMLPSAAPAEAAPTPAPAPTSVPPTLTPLPPTATLPSLAVGQVVESGNWHVALLRPEDAVMVDGSIGTIQPRGRFVLALLAIGNSGNTPERIPTDLIVLADSAGQRYTAQPALSTAYLSTYGRGQHGDLGMEDLLPPDGSNKSVPILFDVPLNARGLRLLVQGTPDGWPIGQ